MKEELIKLSEEKGFKSELLKTCCADEWFHLWCCDLQKWLREEHNLTIIPDKCDNKGNWEVIIESIILSPNHKWQLEPEASFKTYELALDRGLIEALKLIKK